MVHADLPDTPLALLGLEADHEPLYRLALRQGRIHRTDLTSLLDLSDEEVGERVALLAARGLVRLDGDAVTAVAPAEALGDAVAAEARRIREQEARLDTLRGRLAQLCAEHGAAAADGGSSAAVQVVDDSPAELLGRLGASCSGDLLWLRPDRWNHPAARELDETVDALIAEGRRSRALFPARVLELAPEVVRARVAAGEQVRVVAAVPTRLAVFGEQAALLPDRWGENTGRRLLVREQSLVAALTAVFEGLWERAMTVPGLDDGPVRGNPQDDERRLLLDQLARGAKDEQIARALGMSLRTVRRRVADLLLDLGVDSRFQAGVEAVRRGWV